MAKYVIKQRQINDLNDLRQNWGEHEKYLAPMLPPQYFGILEWIANAPKKDVLEYAAENL